MRRSMNEKTSKITDLLSLMGFGLFAVCVILVLLTGAKVYRNLVDSGSRSYESRTAVQYIATRVRQTESVSVEEFDGCCALVGTEEIDGEIYLTRVYCYDGYLRELFSAEDAWLQADAGEKILPVESAGFALEDGLLTVRVDQQEMTLYLRGGEK